ncbi:FAD:protein FMN transferase [Planctobacterium marinum]|uniref:FAD:protein FMN transferase n=1 Tax=Planctobacterium marinum TaxID=1631968 RepID=UPI001E4F3D34|nr:FAD:protein FMN transferase [Planctobacterium marinum]MCC2605145.1 FAD:protein FMN transferase [Planctobacterium marinum]
MNIVSLRVCLFTLIALCLMLVAGCQQPPAEVHLSGPTMGTTYNIKYWSENTTDSTLLQQRIDDELVHINKLMSTYDPASELSMLNQTKSTEPYPLSSETLVVVEEALRIGKLSNQYLDITVGPLVNLWGFGPQARPEVIPSDVDIDAARARVGIDKLSVSGNSLSRAHPDMYVDLSTVAKGYGVDQVAEIVASFGIDNYLVEIGGEMRVAGVKRNGQAWRIAIEKPVSLERAIQEIITVGNNAIATSGDYRNYYEEDGMRYSHLIDPKTGKPIQHNLVSVTVVHPSCLTADGYSTAIAVMGKDAGLAMALENDLAVLLITRENGEFKEYTTPGFDSFMSKKG